MNILLFDTCLGACSVAAIRSAGEGPGSGRAAAVAFRFERLERGHAERLMPMIGEAMAEAPFGFSEIDRIIVTTGPGTFTGQRVGIAAARALSLATGATVGTLSSLEVMAHTAAAALGGEIQGKVLAVAVDARRGEIYFQAFSGGALTPLADPALTTPEAAAAGLAGADVLVVGSGADAVLSARGAETHSPMAARLLTLEPDVRFVPYLPVSADSVMPLPMYLRPPDAKPQDGSSLKRVS